MSWSVTVDRTPAMDAFEAVGEAFKKDYPTPAPGVQQQFDAAQEALGAVLPIVEPDGAQMVIVRVSGHANQSAVRGASIVVSVGQTG